MADEHHEHKGSTTTAPATTPHSCPVVSMPCLVAWRDRRERPQLRRISLADLTRIATLVSQQLD